MKFSVEITLYMMVKSLGQFIMCQRDLYNSASYQKKSRFYPPTSLKDNGLDVSLSLTEIHLLPAVGS